MSDDLQLMLSDISAHLELNNAIFAGFCLFVGVACGLLMMLLFWREL